MKNKIQHQYKFLQKGMKFRNGNLTWKLNEWVKVDGELKMCENGLHSSIEPYDAFSYVPGEILAVVECRGDYLMDDDKFCWREQRVIDAYPWTKEDSLRIAVFAAELCLKNFEKWDKYDFRPRQAIEAAKRVLLGDTVGNRAAAKAAAKAAGRAARAARTVEVELAAAESAGMIIPFPSVWNARSAAEAAEAAEVAAWTAKILKKKAAEAAEAAARAARAAESSAAWQVKFSRRSVVKKIQRLFRTIVEEKRRKKKEEG